MSRFTSALCRINLGSLSAFRESQSQCRAHFARYFSQSSARNGSAGEGFHRTSNFDKKILVWSKMYPSIAEVPDEVTNIKMKKAKDMFRIRASILMAVAIMGLGVLYVQFGKLTGEREGKFEEQNEDHHFEFPKKND